MERGNYISAHLSDISESGHHVAELCQNAGKDI